MTWKYQKKLRGSKKKKRKKRQKQQNRKSFKYRNSFIEYDRKEGLGSSIKAV